LQQLLLPVDEAQLQLQQVLLQLEMPLAEAWQGKDLREARPMIQRLQLQQLLAQRQRQVQQLQAEVRQLRGELFLALSSQPVLTDGRGGDDAGSAASPRDGIPSIFSS
jgi:DNA-binding transcriptional MerR regulator